MHPTTMRVPMKVVFLCAAAMMAVLAPANQASARLAPTIASLSPNQVVVGAQGMTIIVRGSEFARNAVVRWNGSDRPTTYVSAV